MTIQKAIKSGKPFRRRGDYFWTIALGERENIKRGLPTYIGAQLRAFRVRDILADDWEIKED